MDALLPAVLAGTAAALLLGVADDHGRLARVLGPGAGTGPGPGAGLSAGSGRGATSGPGLSAAHRPRAPRLRRLLRDPQAPSSRVVAAVLAGLAGALLGGSAAAVVSAAVAVALLVLLSSRRAAAAVNAERRCALEACAALAAELRSGRAAGPALDAAVLVSVGPLRSVLQAGAAAARFGGDVPGALLAEPARRTTAVPELPRGLAACWQVCAGTGTGLAASVERLEEGLRAREVARRAVDAELAGPRATAGLLAVLPVGGIALAAALGAGPVHVLLHTPAGNVCLLAGVALDLAGIAWTRALARRAAAAV